MSLNDPEVDLPGGKGCTQAVAAAKLVATSAHADEASDARGKDSAAERRVYFAGQFGNDAAAQSLKAALQAEGVDTSLCGHHDDCVSGRGWVLVTPEGQVTAVVSGGSNLRGWATWREAWELVRHTETSSSDRDPTDRPSHPVLQTLDQVLQECSCVLLQREVPEHVNQLVALLAQRHGVCVLQDMGGQDRPMEMLHLCDYIIPNETELMRLAQRYGAAQGSDSDMDTAPDDATVLRLAQLLQQHGARNVLVTRASRGSMLLTPSGRVLHQPALLVDQVVDETGAGDCFRAAFAVALSENKTLEECLQRASAAGACSVQTRGAVPSTPTRQQVRDRWRAHIQAEQAVLNVPRGDGLMARGGAVETNERQKEIDSFPFLIGSRLNSMKDRPELWKEPLSDVREWVRRQSTVRGLSCVDFNYPQHFIDWTKEEAKAALDAANLKAGAVCLRFPTKFARGAMNHPDQRQRDEATQLVMEAAQVAQYLGCNEVVVWSGECIL